MLAAAQEPLPPPRRAGQRGSRSRFGAEAPLAVLLVEDSDPDAGLVEEILEDEALDIELSRACSLADAERFPADAFELILLDLGLPDGVGVEVVDRVRRMAGHTPIVVLTGHEDDRLARECLKRGAQDFVRKGELDSHSLLRAIEHARAREHARRLERKLESAHRLATLGRLTATVAHEINNPATFIQLNSAEALSRLDALLKSQDTVTPSVFDVLVEVRALLEETLAGTDRIVALVQDLQAETNKAVREADAVDVAEVCRSTCAMAGHRLRGPGHLRLQLEDMPLLEVDRGRLGQVLLNLVVNALQSLSGNDPEDEVTVATHYDDGMLEVRVSDTGAGIPLEDQERIFNPFFTTKPADQGTGLGLSICRDLIEGMGGTLTVASQPGQGSVLSLQVPAQPASAPLPQLVDEAPRNAAATTGSSRRRVLLVDDDDEVLRPLTRALSRHHHVTPAQGAHEALRKTALADFDIIFCDLVMPEMDGVQLIEELWARYPKYASRVVVLSGGATTERTATFLQDSGVPVLAKPASIRLLRSIIEQLTAPVPLDADSS